MRVALKQSFATAVRPSLRVLQTASMFGIGVDEEHQLDIVPRTEIDLPIPGPGIVFITGPSGGGKSTVLRLIAERIGNSGEGGTGISPVRTGRMPVPPTVINLNDLPELPDAPLVDVFDVPLKQAASLLALAGLGDAFLMLRRPCELSDGQRARLRIAHAMLLASRHSPAVLIADEFSATLDRLTAKIIARNIRRWIDRVAPQSQITFIAATTHDDLLESLDPDVLIEKGLGDAIEIVNSRNRKIAVEVRENGANEPPPSGDGSCRNERAFKLRIEDGSFDDYKSLAQFHYRSSRCIVGVLLRTLPHLGCVLRDVATNDRYRGVSARESAMLLNQEMRTIARVVIHPQWRGLGLAVDLVRHALAYPERGQVYTESLAAMGQVHPFFEKAGMTRYDRPPHAAHARLLDALARLEIEQYLLASPRTFLKRLRECDEQMQTWFEHELALWAKSAARKGRSQAREEVSLNTMLTLARDQLLTLPVYYIFDHSSSPQITQRPQENERR